jgi:integrase
MAKNLWQKGHQYYFKTNVPRPLRQHFLSERGNPVDSIWKPLGADRTIAKIEAPRLLAAYELIFARLRAGEKLSAEQIKAEIAEALNPPILTVNALINPTMSQMLEEQARQTAWLKAHPTAFRSPQGETISGAASAWFDELQRDPSAAVKQATLDGHKLRVQAFIEHAGDVPLASVTRVMASDFLAKIAQGGKANRTTNNYATTMAGLFKSATHRGRFTGDNPFEGQKRKAGGESYEPFTPEELQTLFGSLPREVKPKKHTPETALPWVALIAAYTGMRLEEICQLTVADIKNVQANGGTLDCIFVHNGDDDHKLKNESSERVIPIHSELDRAGLLRYRDALPKDGLLFPGLERRASKGNKIGARVGELFSKRLKALRLKRKGLVFHSFRHTVAQRLEAAAVSQTDAARILGHTIAGMSYGVYSSGPGLKRLAAVIEAIAYDGMSY